MVAAGFQEVSPGLWNRRNGDELHVVEVQKHRADARFCVNLGVHFAFLPVAGTEAALKGLLSSSDCELKLRLTGQPADQDAWWPMDDGGVTDVAALLPDQATAVFHRYRLDGPLATLDATSVERGTTGLLDSMTRVRACLLLARMHERLGNLDKCVEAASAGLRLAGMAVGPKKALKDILARCVTRVKS